MRADLQIGSRLSGSQDLITGQIQAGGAPVDLTAGTLTIRVVTAAISPQVLVDDAEVTIKDANGNWDYRMTIDEATYPDGADVLVTLRFVRDSDGVVLLRPTEGAMRHRIHPRP